MPGPAPDPNALRRDRKDDASWTSLPSTPRVGPFPCWPLPTASDRELELWGSLWAKPQGSLWLLYGQEHFVAVYVRRSIEAEESGSAVTLGGLTKKMADDLLLNIPAMHKARVKIAADEVAVRRSSKSSTVRLSASERLKARNVEVG
jgi:hypothetical protein